MENKKNENRVNSSKVNSNTFDMGNLENLNEIDELISNRFNSSDSSSSNISGSSMSIFSFDNIDRNDIKKNDEEDGILNKINHHSHEDNCKKDTYSDVRDDFKKEDSKEKKKTTKEEKKTEKKAKKEEKKAIKEKEKQDKIEEKKIIKESKELKKINMSPIEKFIRRLRTVVLIILFLIGANYAKTTYDEYKAEEARLDSLDTNNLDLKTIINTVDDYSNGALQLNWKDVTAITAHFVNNYTENINEEYINMVCGFFVDVTRVRTFDEVVSVLSDVSEKDVNRIYSYRDALEYYGYMPERLTPESSQMQFIESIKSAAINNYKETGILTSITIAQAILESNWGESSLTQASNNLFGIKADSSWKGEYVIFETKEFNDKYIKDKFRKYENIGDSIADHSEFLVKNKRYKEGGVFEAKTYKEQALALQESGYSTAEDENGNKTYAFMLEQLIRQYNLQLIDWEVNMSMQ